MSVASRAPRRSAASASCSLAAEVLSPAGNAQIVCPTANNVAHDALKRIKQFIPMFHHYEEQQRKSSGQNQKRKKPDDGSTQGSNEDTNLFALIITKYNDNKAQPVCGWWQVNHEPSQPCQSGKKFVVVEYVHMINAFAGQAALSTAFEGAKKYGIPEEVFFVFANRNKKGRFVPVGPTDEEHKQRKGCESTSLCFNNEADTVFAWAMMDAFNQKGLSNEEKEKIKNLYKQSMIKVGLPTVFNRETIRNPKWMEAAVKLLEQEDETLEELMTMAMAWRKPDDGVEDKGWFTVHPALVPLEWVQKHATRPEWKKKTWFRFSREQCSEARKDVRFTYCPGLNPFTREQEQEQEEGEGEEEEERLSKKIKVYPVSHLKSVV